AGLSVGFLYYRDDREVVSSACDGVLPSSWERDDILAMIHSSIHNPDPELAALVPLAFNVGSLVGFLSALAADQPEDAEMGLVMLGVIVVPLLVEHPGTRASLLVSDKALPRSAAPGCDKPFGVSRVGRPSRFCSGACRVRAHRAKLDD